MINSSNRNNFRADNHYNERNYSQPCASHVSDEWDVEVDEIETNKTQQRFNISKFFHILFIYKFFVLGNSNGLIKKLIIFLVFLKI